MLNKSSKNKQELNFSDKRERVVVWETERRDAEWKKIKRELWVMYRGG